ncbi:hypothetical protein BGZ46_010587 [Entomortierella lignicola]|nr:hypothetical protein BGZ46_010587 [Entomortierella lignicola]
MTLTIQSASQLQPEHDLFDCEQVTTAPQTTETQQLLESQKEDKAEESIMTFTYSNDNNESKKADVLNKEDSIAEVIALDCNRSEDLQANDLLIHEDKIKSVSISPLVQSSSLPSSQSSESNNEQRLPQQIQPSQPSIQQNRGPSSKTLTTTKPTRLAIPIAHYRSSSGERTMSRFPPRAVNRLEVENAYLQNQNNSLNKDIHHCRQTVLALKNILAQKEELIDKMRQEYHQAYLKTKFMESILAEHQSFGVRGAISPPRESRSEEPLFDEQERQQLGYLIRQLGRDGEDELSEEDEDLSEEENISYESGTISDNQGDMLDHGLGTDDEEEEEDGANDDEELFKVHSREFQQELERLSPRSRQRFRELSLEMFSHDNHMSPTTTNSNITEHSRPTLEPSLLPYPTSDGSRKQGAGLQQVIRRRPSLRINPIATSPNLSAPMESFKDSIHISPNNSDITETSSSPSIQPNVPTEFESEKDHFESTAKSKNQVPLRDSGHFASELVDDRSTEQQPTIINLHFEFECVSEPISQTSDDEEVLTSNATEPMTTALNQDLQPQFSSHPYLGVVSQPIAALTTLTCVHIEADMSSTALTTESTTLPRDNIPGSRAGVIGEEDNNALLVRDNQGQTGSFEGSSQNGLEEVKSESSSTVAMTPLSRVSVQNDASSSSTTSTDAVIPITVSHQDETQINIDEVDGSSPSPEPLSLSKIKGKGVLHRVRSKTFSLNKNKRKQSMEFVSSEASWEFIPAASGVDVLTSDSTNPISSSTTRQGNTTPFLTRVWSGLGKHVTGLFTVSRRSTEGTRSRRRSSGERTGMGMNEDRPTSPLWNSSLKSKNSNDRMDVGKGIGIRRLGGRSRSRLQLTPQVVSVNVMRDNNGSAKS